MWIFGLSSPLIATGVGGNLSVEEIYKVDIATCNKDADLSAVL